MDCHKTLLGGVEWLLMDYHKTLLGGVEKLYVDGDP